MDTLFGTLGGLPLHPLVVHFAVVLIPLGAIGLVVVSVVARFRKPYLPLVIGTLGAGAVFAFVSKQSGEFLSDTQGNPGQHAALGDVLFPASVGLVALAVTLWLFTRSDRPVVHVRLAIAASIVGALSVSTLTFFVGHSGATATWGSVAESAEPTESPSASPTATDDGITMADVRTHNSAGDCWIVVENAVVDLTSFISRHPGGASALTALCGTDATSAFQSQHGSSRMPANELQRLTIGTLAR